MTKCLWILLGVMLVSACTRLNEPRRQSYETFVGIDEKGLVATVGVPDSTYELGSERFLSYTKTGSKFVTRTDSVTGYTSGSYMPMVCRITFVFYKNRLDNWKYEGNMCNEYISSINLH